MGVGLNWEEIGGLTRAMVFSSRMCFPWAAAFLTHSKWVAVGRGRYTASTSGEFRTSS